MYLQGNRKQARLPKRFPIGTTYVVEGRGDPAGQLCVFSRYVVLPSGELDPQRLTVLADALEETGAVGEVVQHLREKGPHVRGCFAVDAVLGRQ